MLGTLNGALEVRKVKLEPGALSAEAEGINEVRARPEAPAAGFPVTPTIISQEGLIGVRNPRFLVFDDERLDELPREVHDRPVTAVVTPSGGWQPLAPPAG